MLRFSCAWQGVVLHLFVCMCVFRSGGRMVAVSGVCLRA